jgi:hypothetical protein
MIDINLIPAASRKKTQEDFSSMVNLSTDVLLGVGSGVVLLLAAVHLVLGVIWALDSTRLSAAKARWEKLEPDKKMLDSLGAESRSLKSKIKLLSGMASQKSLPWAPKFNAVSDALPKGVWLRKMTLDKAGLSMEGSVAIKSRNEINNVGLFLSSLKQNDGFMKDFSSLEVNSIQSAKADAIDVTDFTVMAKWRGR